MKDDDDAKLFLVGIIVGAFLAFAATGCIMSVEWRHNAVKHGAAHYDTQTGEWQWNDQPKDK